MCDQAVAAWGEECWDGWRGERIGSPVVVVAMCVPRDDVGPLRNFVQVT
ncbi:hypothetical protein SLNWT_5866 [Streptomyces albus]|uniref:Uncharacterized protein n=1 Tax=Streptomyces albus (strain ATCC 21838 / DSM 41398 / FERM P-419 / JCM 4703 / NBRC 107858) TaxID=1081613 RepID=A0A0B5F737_STRA4|nr:hypothetical protein SLNWT_5866 [Streptomyces albus]AOU80544.1 hypothetical protein SLNHY_5853 [Streptomyces albus]AYN36254.1 hypothetical protein DUI70_5759 [Streptomyces albus]